MTPCRLASNYRRDIYQSRRPGVLEYVLRQQQYCQSQEFAADSALTAVLLACSHVEVSNLQIVFQPARKPTDDRPLPLDTDFNKTEKYRLLQEYNVYSFVFSLPLLVVEGHVVPASGLETGTEQEGKLLDVIKCREFLFLTSRRLMSTIVDVPHR